MANDLAKQKPKTQQELSSIYREFRKIMPSTKVFVLTNVTDVKVETFFLDKPNCYFNNKSIKPFPFARKVKTILEKTMQATQMMRKKLELLEKVFQIKAKQ